MSASPVDMTGQRYGAVTALGRTGATSSRSLIWSFLCDCGNQFESSGHEVRRGNVKSCPECAKANKLAGTTTHGKSKYREYAIWIAMKRRCYNPNTFGYSDYGGRGITVCDRWRNSFDVFLLDMGSAPHGMSIDRYPNNDGNYEPSNCRWATRKEQANNKRNNRTIVIDGIAKNLVEWSRHSGITEGAIRGRIKRGLTGAELIAPSVFRDSLTFNGQQKSLDKWSKETGLKKGTLSSRIYVYGWSIEKALTTGVSI